MSARTLTWLLARPERSGMLSMAQWQSVLTIARAERLDATLAHRLSAEEMPAGVRRVLHEATTRCDHSQAIARWEVERIADALEPVGTRVVLLKGAAHLLAGSAAAAGRFVGDVDILVGRGSIAAVEQALLAAGWEWAKPDPYDDAYYRRWMHELPPLIHADRGQMVDVHHTILPLTARPEPHPAAILARAEAVPGTPLLVPSVADRLVHGAAHLLADGELEGGLRNLWDIHCLAGEVEDRSELESVAAGHDLTPVLDRSLQLSRALFGTAASGAVDRPLRLVDRLFVRRLLSRDGWGRPRRPVTRLGFTARAHVLRMPLRLLLPHLWRKWRR